MRGSRGGRALALCARGFIAAAALRPGEATARKRRKGRTRATCGRVLRVEFYWHQEVDHPTRGGLLQESHKIVYV